MYFHFQFPRIFLELFQLFLHVLFTLRCAARDLIGSCLGCTARGLSGGGDLGAGGGHVGHHQPRIGGQPRARQGTEAGFSAVDPDFGSKPGTGILIVDR